MQSYKLFGTTRLARGFHDTTKKPSASEGFSLIGGVVNLNGIELTKE